MSKRLLVICGGHIIGGTEIVTLGYLQELKKTGVHIYCITNAWGNGKFNERLDKLSIPYSSVRLGFIYPKNLSWTLDTLLNYPNARREIMNAVRIFKPDLCYHTSFRSIFMTSHFLKLKHYYHVHDNIRPTFFNRILLKTIQKRTEAFIAVSNTVAMHLILCGIRKEKIVTLYNGTSLNAKRGVLDRSSILKIGIVGQVSEHKGHSLLVKALIELAKTNDLGFELKIFGSGDPNYVNDLKNTIDESDIADYVYWMGFNEDLDKIYADINLVVMPTISVEPFGMVIIEAGIRNVLVLASDSGGPAELIDDGVNGLLFKSGNVADLVKKLQMISSGKIDLATCTDNNYKKVSENFNITLQTNTLLDILN